MREGGGAILHDPSRTFFVLLFPSGPRSEPELLRLGRLPAPPTAVRRRLLRPGAAGRVGVVPCLRRQGSDADSGLRLPPNRAVQSGLTPGERIDRALIGDVRPSPRRPRESHLRCVGHPDARVGLGPRDDEPPTPTTELIRRKTCGSTWKKVPGRSILHRRRSSTLRTHIPTSASTVVPGGRV